MAITPDTKNWTWVLESRCPECGFDASTLSERDVAAELRNNAAEWPAVLERDTVRDRPDEGTWSALEYAAHVRDVFRVFAQRLALMLAEDDPTFANWDQDETAIADRYNEQDPAVVSRELVEAGNALAAAFDAVPDASWSRRGLRGDGAVFTVATLARYLAHDPVHHLWDVNR
jgi:DinB superfamily